MDDLRKLFKKINGRNHSSFEALSENYGWKLYAYIRKHSADRAEADRIFSETFQRFYAMLEHFEGDDPIEAMLIACADQAKAEISDSECPEREIGRWELGQEAGFALPRVDEKKVPGKRDPSGTKLVYGLCLILLIVGILTVLWAMGWMLMAMDVIPYMDLGYDWINEMMNGFF